MSLWRPLWWTSAYFNVRRNFQRRITQLLLHNIKIITQHDVENKQLKEENEKLESRKVESKKVEYRKVETRKEEN